MLDSAKRGCVSFAVAVAVLRAGSCAGMVASGPSAVRAARAVRLLRGGGGVVSPILWGRRGFV